MSLAGCSAARQTALRARECFRLSDQGLLEGVVVPGEIGMRRSFASCHVLILQSDKLSASASLHYDSCSINAWLRKSMGFQELNLFSIKGRQRFLRASRYSRASLERIMLARGNICFY